MHTVGGGRDLQPDRLVQLVTVPLVADPFFTLAAGPREPQELPQARPPAERHPRPAGGRGRHDRGRPLAAPAVLLPGEGNGPLFQIAAQPPESQQIDTLNIYDDASQEDLTGTLTSTALTGLAWAPSSTSPRPLGGGTMPFGEPAVYPGGISYGTIVVDPVTRHVPHRRATTDDRGPEHPARRGQRPPDHRRARSCPVTTTTPTARSAPSRSHGGITTVHGGGNWWLRGPRRLHRDRDDDHPHRWRLVGQRRVHGRRRHHSRRHDRRHRRLTERCDDDDHRRHVHRRDLHGQDRCRPRHEDGRDPDRRRHDHRHRRGRTRPRRSSSTATRRRTASGTAATRRRSTATSSATSRSTRSPTCRTPRTRTTSASSRSRTRSASPATTSSTRSALFAGIVCNATCSTCRPSGSRPTAAPATTRSSAARPATSSPAAPATTRSSASAAVDQIYGDSGVNVDILTRGLTIPTPRSTQALTLDQTRRSCHVDRRRDRD